MRLSKRLCSARGKRNHVAWSNKMKSPSMKLFATLVFAFSLDPGKGLAQSQSGKEPPKAISLTGCLGK